MLHKEFYTAECIYLFCVFIIRIIESHVGSKSIDDKFAMMLDQWFKVASEHTWSEVITALEAIGNRRLANIIGEKYRPEG